MKYLFLFLFLFLILKSCSEVTTEKNRQTTTQNNPLEEVNTIQLTQEQVNTLQIETGRLEKKNISFLIRVNGKIDLPPENQISVHVPMSGYLVGTKLLPGMMVKKNQELAILQDYAYIQIQEDYLLAKSDLELSEQEYLRQKDLSESKAISDKAFFQTKNTFYNKKVKLNSLIQKLSLLNIKPETLTQDNISKNITITSPINGIVLQVFVNKGKYISSTETMFELINMEDIHLTLKIFEKDIKEIEIGQKVIAYNNNYPEKKYECEIILISRNIGADGGVEVHCHFVDFDSDLLVGMYMNAEIHTKTSSVFVIPEKAIINFEGKYYVFNAEADNVFRMTEVEIGNKEDDFVEIKNYSQLINKNIVINNNYDILMSLKNKPEE